MLCFVVGERRAICLGGNWLAQVRYECNNGLRCEWVDLSLNGVSCIRVW